MENLAAPLFKPIMKILEDFPGGIREYDLLRELHDQGIAPFSGNRRTASSSASAEGTAFDDPGTDSSDSSDSSDAAEDEPGDPVLALFQSHFFLFHVLYQLRRSLKEEKKGDLRIFCLDIRLLPPDNGTQASRNSDTAAGVEDMEAFASVHLPAEIDQLESYYLDWNNYSDMDSAGIQRFLEEARRRILAWYGRDDHLAALGLEDPVSDEEIRRCYRRLCRIHHPDTGGDPAAFARIQSAMDALRT